MTEPNLPADDGARELAVADPEDEKLTHLAVVGDTYTILMAGADTNGRYTLIDMLIPAGGGPPPHRHDFEEMFYVLDGELEVTVRDTTSTAKAGVTVNVPSNVPHAFRNPTGDTVRLLCLASPAGLEEFFAGFGDEVPTRTSPAPELTAAEQQERMRTAAELAPKFRIETL